MFHLLRKTLLAALATFAAAPMYSQGYWPKKYSCYGFEHSSIEQQGWVDVKSKLGFSVTSGRTFYLHKPIKDLVRFGLDLTWSDVTYANYAITFIDQPYSWDMTMHEVGYSVHFGPSLTVNPVGKLCARAYFHFAPKFQLLIDDGDLHTALAIPHFAMGLNVSYRIVGLGVEYQWGSCKMDQMFQSNIPDDYDYIIDDKIKTKTGGLRGYITLTF